MSTLPGVVAEKTRRAIHVSGYEREGRDFYATPDWVTESLAAACDIPPSGVGAVLRGWRHGENLDPARPPGDGHRHRVSWFPAKVASISWPASRCRRAVAPSSPIRLMGDTGTQKGQGEILHRDAGLPSPRAAADGERGWPIGPAGAAAMGGGASGRGDDVGRPILRADRADQAYLLVRHGGSTPMPPSTTMPGWCSTTRIRPEHRPRCCMLETYFANVCIQQHYVMMRPIDA